MFLVCPGYAEYSLFQEFRPYLTDTESTEHWFFFFQQSNFPFPGKKGSHTYVWLGWKQPLRSSDSLSTHSSFLSVTKIVNDSKETLSHTVLSPGLLIIHANAQHLWSLYFTHANKAQRSMNNGSTQMTGKSDCKYCFQHVLSKQFPNARSSFSLISFTPVKFWEKSLDQSLA